jgi:hypothetical protein
MNLWVLCAREEAARLYVWNDLSEEPEACGLIRHPGLSRSTVMLERWRYTAVDFPAYLAQVLDAARAEGRMEAWILCADSAFVERTRGHLTPQVEQCLIGTVGLDLFEAHEEGLFHYLSSHLDRHPQRKVA